MRLPLVWQIGLICLKIAFIRSSLQKGVHLSYGRRLKKASDASEALKLNATNLYQLQLIDEIVSEGVGAHEAPEPVMAALKKPIDSTIGRITRIAN